MSCYRLAALLIAGLCAVGPALAQSPPAAEPPAASPSPEPLKAGDAFGQEVTLPERTIIYFNGHANRDSVYETLVEAHKSLKQYLDKQGIKPDGPAMTIYTETDDTGFGFHAAVPVAEPPKEAPTGDIAVGKAPSGKALKFVHRGPYDAMDTTYEAITNYLDDKQIEAKEQFFEEYVTDLLTADPDKLIVNIYVPVK